MKNNATRQCGLHTEGKHLENIQQRRWTSAHTHTYKHKHKPTYLPTKAANFVMELRTWNNWMLIVHRCTYIHHYYPWMHVKVSTFDHNVYCGRLRSSFNLPTEQVSPNKSWPHHFIFFLAYRKQFATARAPIKLAVREYKHNNNNNNTKVPARCRQRVDLPRGTDSWIECRHHRIWWRPHAIECCCSCNTIAVVANVSFDDHDDDDDGGDGDGDWWSDVLCTTQAQLVGSPHNGPIINHRSRDMHGNWRRIVCPGKWNQHHRRRPINIGDRCVNGKSPGGIWRRRAERDKTLTR